MKTKLFFLFPVLLFVVFSCRKNDVAAPKANDRIKDSTIDYARAIYLWYSQIPASFDEQAYTDPNEIMKGIRPYSREPGFPDPVDKWSFAIKQQEWDNISAGIAGDFGLNVFFKQEGDLRVRLVEKESPAGLANIRRGWRITKINGSSNITTSNAAAISAAIYNSSQVSLTFQKPDGGFADISLSAASYREHPVLLDSVYVMGGIKAGYMVYNSFLGDSLETVSEFQRVFNRFGSEGVNDVIIDLRYNGGGYVFYQQVLANYLVRNAADGQLMMSTGYNDNYSSNNRSVNFSKQGALNLPRIFFIVSSNTASASELLIIT